MFFLVKHTNPFETSEMWCIVVGKQIIDMASLLRVSVKFTSERHFASKMFKEKYAKILPLKTPTMIAIDNFDFYYGPLYGNDWPSIRLGLLTPNKYFAVLNKFARLINFLFSKQLVISKICPNFSRKIVFYE